jgi:hypothetical protein
MCLEEDVERRGLSMDVKNSLYEGVVAPALLYGSEG